MSGQVPDAVRDAVVQAYYPRAVGIADAARARAQAAYAIASAIAAALVAAGVFGDIEDRAGVVQVLGFLALIGWIVAAGLFMVAVAAPFQAADLPDQPSREQFINATLDAASAERKKIDGWQKHAWIGSGAAAVLTVFALVAAVVADPASAVRPATVHLTASGRAALMAACGDLSGGLTGDVDTADLEYELVAIQTTACGGVDAVSVPRAHITAVTFTKTTKQ